jgi:hypothetical protein
MKFQVVYYLLASATVDAFQSQRPLASNQLTTSSRTTLSTTFSRLYSEKEEKKTTDTINEDVILEDADGLGVALMEFKENKTEGIDLNGSKEDNEDVMQLLIDVEEEAERAAVEVFDDLVDDACEIDEEGLAVDEICIDEEKKAGFRALLKGTIGKTLQMVRGMPTTEEEEAENLEGLAEGDALESGWSQRGNSSAIRRNAEVWKFSLKCVFRALKPRSMRKKGATEEEIEQAQIEAATFIRDGLLTLGPTFVKLGQVISTRTDVLPKTYTDVLKTLQDEVPAFSGARAKEIVSAELGRPADEIFSDFSEDCLKAASLGQVHTAFYKGQKVAIKVQRAGLKELFDVDLKNLRKLAVLLDKFDPKTDGAVSKAICLTSQLIYHCTYLSIQF